MSTIILSNVNCILSEQDVQIDKKNLVKVVIAF